MKEDKDLKEVRSAGRALLKDRESGKIPPARAAQLRKVLESFFGLGSGQEIAEDVLRQAASLDPV